MLRPIYILVLYIFICFPRTARLVNGELIALALIAGVKTAPRPPFHQSEWWHACQNEEHIASFEMSATIYAKKGVL